MLYALRYEKESPVQLMQLFNKLASRSAKYKPGVMYLTQNAFVEILLVFNSICFDFGCYHALIGGKLAAKLMIVHMVIVIDVDSYIMDFNRGLDK